MQRVNDADKVCWAAILYLRVIIITINQHHIFTKYKPWEWSGKYGIRIISIYTVIKYGKDAANHVGGFANVAAQIKISTGAFFPDVRDVIEALLPNYDENRNIYIQLLLMNHQNKLLGLRKWQGNLIILIILLRKSFCFRWCKIHDKTFLRTWEWTNHYEELQIDAQ